MILSRLPGSQINACFLLLTDDCNGFIENNLPAHSGRNRSGFSPDFLSQFHSRNCSLNIFSFNYVSILTYISFIFNCVGYCQVIVEKLSLPEFSQSSFRQFYSGSFRSVFFTGINFARFISGCCSVTAPGTGQTITHAPQ